MKTDNICSRCKKPMDTTIAEMNAIHYHQNFYACEHCGMLYSIYRPEIVIYKPLGYWEDVTEDDWGKEVVSDKEYKKKYPLYVPPIYKK
jgi:DNA-directed RNA polymerase subunit RPC12/RpoP